jgi:dihydrofolate synthase / folylpolyglutamate synthase
VADVNAHAVDDAWSWLASRRRSERRRDPAVARALLDALAIPDPPSVVHVVGTNGKGSVATALAAMASASGRRSGRFLSPHVEQFEERIAVDGVAIAPATVIAFAARARALVDAGVDAALRAGFFEWTLALALQAFDDAGVELAVIEAGVGARRDATLALGNVIGSVVTNVDLDHVETLGPDLASIARDKAAAIRPGVPVVTAARGVALEVVRETARSLSAPLLVVGEAETVSALPEALLARARRDGWPATRIENLRVAFALGRLLGWPESALASAADTPPPPARFERFQLDGVQVVLDGAHDPAAARRLALELPSDTVLLFAALARKQGGATLAALAPHVARVVLTTADPSEAPGPWPADARLADPEQALATALAWAGPGGTVAIAGSLYLAGRLRPVLLGATAGAGVTG